MSALVRLETDGVAGLAVAVRRTQLEQRACLLDREGMNIAGVAAG